VKDIAALIKNNSNAKEFTINVPSEYDYRYMSDKREDLFNLLKLAHSSQKNIGILKIFGVTCSNLKQHTVTENDKRFGIIKLPDSKFRLKEEELDADNLEEVKP
jgi:hypothetical protein